MMKQFFLIEGYVNGRYFPRMKVDACRLYKGAPEIAVKRER